ncbi:MAG: cytochrome d ubiquinol oxidase subunit II [Bdellovibrionales bacterium RIFOXYD12_FULL_39_22]|nr:MAG: cytochrome d ubiquinol oxidase subunit II [Bdellovibrionales bacterium RIFOXYB1_FULL_39_21]OFZ43827.1 MAG: cytochrome d ubiquinol oxidase subunit II [Bdellovibrionales bacterium RIFOXYC12_FULL_39_17]OFZ48839.1 MAG: cytochrome d ubiquinol oxidase subunit II [Bdellovibrionales bacterium RIFOXYC1_FULL_39_130]OFZ76572.1 MAG: cytochrome d ubiquinol oxidase subunit II [Bdellovibrionales bacterium RIFOXYD1_FULL_39_84]OFZ94806.1 MAG: cytochrome d ubiquinol oxidase subunit II [Bdellovibrionales 
MIGQLDYTTLQQLWWIIASLVGSLFLFLNFVQGGQTLLFTLPKNDKEKSLIINSLGRKWELTFTTLVLFGGALFAAFPKFYATSFGGAYWVWMLILFTFIIQAVSYEYRKKPQNFLGAKTYEVFLFINGSVGILLIGAAIGTFFTGSSFSINEMNQVTWQTPYYGLEAALNFFNLSLGIFLVLNARVLGAMYLLNNIEHAEINVGCRRLAWINFMWSLPFLLFVLAKLLLMEGHAIRPENGEIFLQKWKYLQNLIGNPLLLLFLLTGLGLVIYGIFVTRFKGKNSGIWFSGPGTVLVGLTLFGLAGLNDTVFYPSTYDLQSGLTIYNASSSHYTLTAMSYVALAIPFVVAYIAYVWRQMDKRQLSISDLSGKGSNKLY